MLPPLVPLYANHSAPVSFKSDFNAGLWYDKFCNRWQKEGHTWTLGENGKKEWINGLSNQKLGTPALLNLAVNRLGRLALALGGEIRCFTTDWRFVTGLGQEHPVENGFAWHHLLGVPFLPGSSVKGVVRAWAEKWSRLTSDEIWRIFGPPGEAGEKRVGSVIFFDALPVKPVQVQADVMTPHYAPYYLSQGNSQRQPPGDWFAPVPIPFLSVAPGQPFLFALAPRRADHPEDRQDCAEAFGLLEDALFGIGAGAKTSAGYGRFKRAKELEQKLKESWL